MKKSLTSTASEMTADIMFTYGFREKKTYT